MVLPTSPEFALEALSLGPLSPLASTSSASPSGRTSADEVRPKAMPAAIKKQGVSAESCVQSMQQSYSIPIPKYEKDFRYVFL